MKTTLFLMGIIIQQRETRINSCMLKPDTCKENFFFFFCTMSETNNCQTGAKEEVPSWSLGASDVSPKHLFRPISSFHLIRVN